MHPYIPFSQKGFSESRNPVSLRGPWRFMIVGVIFLLLLISINFILGFSASALTFSSENLNEVNYGLIIDAGSTGSRLFLYRWTSKSDRQLISIEPVLDDASRPVVKKVSPGLSSFADDPHNATDYLRPLFDYAVEFVPVTHRPYTPVFILATAGMRLVPIEKQNAILRNIRENLPAFTPFQLIPEHIRVIEGRWEGVYSWIAVNYILGRFQVNDLPRPATVGMIDMGGASMQVAVELDSDQNFRSNLVEVVNLGCHEDDNIYKYRLFVSTFLGYGVNEGLRRYEQKLSDDNIADNSSYIRDVCLPVNLIKRVVREDGSQFVRKGVGDWDSCLNSLSELISKPATDTECSVIKCLLGHVPAPPISFSSVELYGFSEYWYSMNDVFSLGGVYNYENMAAASRRYCQQKWSTIQNMFRKSFYPRADESRLQAQCFKSAWIAAVLHTGLSVDKKTNKFRSVFDIRGQEVQWTLGAMLYHMRHFPLREARRNHAWRKPTSSAGWNISYFILMVVLVSFFFFTWSQWRKRNTLGIRRQPSMWSYMMVPQQQSSVGQYT